MKLIRFGAYKEEKAGVLAADGTRRDASVICQDWTGESLMDAKGMLAGVDIQTLPIVPEDVRWGAPLPRPGKIICIGANYADHAKEGGGDVPPEPIIFQKATNAMVGPNDTVIIPKGSTTTDYEVELAVIIGKDASYVESEEAALDHIFGYVLANDVSERTFQSEHCGQWTKGKSCDTFFPCGPMVVTADEIEDPLNLKMELKVNGDVRQSSSTSYMVYKPAFLVHYLSQFMTLEAGDIISTGTPAGVGFGMNPPGFLKDGDVVEATIEGLGSQTLTFRNHQDHEGNSTPGKSSADTIFSD